MLKVLAIILVKSLKNIFIALYLESSPKLSVSYMCSMMSFTQGQRLS